MDKKIINVLLYSRSLTVIVMCLFNTLRPRQKGSHFTDDVFKCIFLYENVWIQIWISLKFVPKGQINSIPALVEIMAWRRPGNKPLSEPMMVRLPTNICVTRPQWVKYILGRNLWHKCKLHWCMIRIFLINYLIPSLTKQNCCWILTAVPLKFYEVPSYKKPHGA